MTSTAMTASRSVRRRPEESRVLDWQKDVAKSTASRAPPEPASTTQIIVNNITTPNVIVSRPTSQTKQETEISTRAIIGTILGASAGAAVAYAMTKGEDENRHAQSSSQKTYPVKRVTETAIVMRPPLTDVRNYQPQRTSTHSPGRPRSHHSMIGPRVETVVSSSRSRREPRSELIGSTPPITQSHTGQTIIRTNNGTKVLAGSNYSRGSHTPSRSKREKYTSSAAGVPLPESKVSTLISKHDTIVPDDSISQVSTMRPKHYEKSSHHHHNNHGSRSASSHRRRPSHTSSRTARVDRSEAQFRRPRLYYDD